MVLAKRDETRKYRTASSLWPINVYQRNGSEIHVDFRNISHAVLLTDSLNFVLAGVGVLKPTTRKTRCSSFHSACYTAINLSTAIGGETEVPVFKIEHTITFTQEIKRSRFRAVAAPVQHEEAAKAFLKSNLDTSANHNCWAWRVGQSYRFSDDGEPSGTAGKPILQAIDGLQLDGVAVIVTRWFGGILLGSGGLMRAYGGTASLCLKSANRIPFVALISVTITCVFGDLALVEARLSGMPDAIVRARHFNDVGAELLVDLPERNATDIATMIVDLTGGRALIAGL